MADLSFPYPILRLFEMGWVYSCVCQVNGKQYIGKTVGSLLRRKGKHLDDAKGGCNFVFHRALRKYGFENFMWQGIFFSTSEAKLVEKEMEYIKSRNTKLPNGYNMTDGGDGFSGYVAPPELRAKRREYQLGRKKSEETRKRISEAKMGMPSNRKGLKWPEEWKKRRSEACLGRRVSEEAKRKISSTLKGRPSPNKGKKMSEETKQKIRQSMIGRPLTEAHKKAMHIGRWGW